MKINEKLKQKLKTILTEDELNNSPELIRQLLFDKLDETENNVIEFTIHTPVEDFIITREELNELNKIREVYSEFLTEYEKQLELINN